MKKLLRGTIAIYAIKLLVISSSFLYYSCQEIEFDNQVSNESLLQRFRDISKNQSQILNNRLADLNPSNSRVNSTTRSTIEGMSEPELKLIIEPVVSSGLDLLISYGISENEIIAEFGSLNSPDISRAALAVSQLENLANDGYVIQGFDESDFVLAGIFIPEAHASEIYDCALQAAGVKVLMELASEGLVAGAKKLGKKGALKLVKKVAARSLGWVGAGVAAYEFGDCMNWW